MNSSLKTLLPSLYQCEDGATADIKLPVLMGTAHETVSFTEESLVFFAKEKNPDCSAEVTHQQE